MISAEMVRQLREKSGAGMMECKRALEETKGDMEAAIDFLRKKGLASAAKKAGRVASEGLTWVTVLDQGKRGSVVEVNCETDFVAKNEDFINFVKDLGVMACESEETSAESLLTKKFSGQQLKASGTTQEVLTGLVAKIGENMTVRRVRSFSCKSGEALGSYLHGGGKVAVLLKAQFKDAKSAQSEAGSALLKDLCMQIAAAKPDYLESTEVPAERLAREKEIYLQQAMESGKPREIAEKMVAGKMSKFYQEFCLVDQAYVKDPALTVKKVVEQYNKTHSEACALKSFARFGLGEGIEKKKDDFAAEVASMQRT